MRFLRSRHISTRIRLATESLNPDKPRSWSLSTDEENGMIHASLRAFLHRSTAPPSRHPISRGRLHSIGGPYCGILAAAYEGRTDCRNPASFAVALYWGIGSSSLNALVKALDRLHMVRGWNSSWTG
jgi:hypothetical protein